MNNLTQAERKPKMYKDQETKKRHALQDQCCQGTESYGDAGAVASASIMGTTHIDIGIIKAVGDKEIILSEASWIADTGRYHDALKGGPSKLNEVEPYLDDVIIGRGAVIDATIWGHKLPRGQK
jgi:hypothetical protein